MDEEELKDREVLRREALWALADLTPGDPAAAAVVNVLDEVGIREQLAGVSGLSLVDLKKVV